MTDAERFQREYRLFIGAERPEERRLRPLIDTMPNVKVRPPPEALSRGGFIAGACHQQCHDTAARMPAVTHIFGWTVSRHYYSSHSVLRDPDGTYRCITPGHVDATELDENGFFDFRIDAEFIWANGGMYRGFRAAEPGEAIIRRDVRRIARAYQDLLERIRGGALTFEQAQQLRL